MKRKLFSMLLVLIMIFSSIDIGYAAPQDDLDKGYLFMTTDGSVTLKAGETYYIGVKGGNGGRTNYNGSTGAVSYYNVKVKSNVTIKLHVGGTGGFPSGRAGGVGGTNSYPHGGKGSDGSYGDIPGTWNVGQGGGGGGAATVVSFPGHTTSSNILTADGGRGARGSDGPTMEDGRIPYGGVGGIGGKIAERLGDKTVAEITRMSEAEGSTHMMVPDSGVIIMKPGSKLDTSNGIKVDDIFVGQHIILYNSINGAGTVFRKESNGTFIYASGASTYSSSTSIGLYPYDFSKYTLSGTGNYQDMRGIILKEDTVFIGGDGSLLRPFYPEPAGSIGLGGNNGGSSTSGSDDMLQKSIIAVAMQIENQLNYQKEKDSNSDKFIPFTLKIRPVNNLTATKSTSIDILLIVEGRELPKVQYNLMINSAVNNIWTNIPSNNIIKISGLSNGYNTIVITVRDHLGNTQTDTSTIWRL